MGSKIYVGGLPYSATESQLNDLFATHGAVESARVITDKFTGQSRGFGFVEMTTAEEAKAAIAALHGTQMDGRTLTVNEAKPQEPRSGGGSRFGGGGGRDRFYGRALTSRGRRSVERLPLFASSLP
ncbi:MAG: RNA recognition motif domain-containing protein [Nitrospiraceae bacterium]